MFIPVYEMRSIEEKSYGAPRIQQHREEEEDCHTEKNTKNQKCYQENIDIGKKVGFLKVQRYFSRA